MDINVKWGCIFLLCVFLVLLSESDASETGHSVERIDMKSVVVTASSWEQKAHGGWRDFPPQLTTDGDLGGKSSWRSEGHGQWIQYDLNEKKSITGMHIAFLNGDARQYTFAVHVSTTGKGDEWDVLIE